MFRQNLGLEAISNTKKHIAAWEHMQTIHFGDDDIVIVLEDDLMRVPSTETNLNLLFKNAKKLRDWDMVFLGISAQQDESKPQEIMPLNQLTRVLPAKDSYIIKPACAKRLADAWDKHRFVMRVQLSWWAHTNPDVRIGYPSRRIFLDGSKLGMFASSVHANNFLSFNKEYMELTKIKDEATPSDILKNMHTIQQLYKAVSVIQSPDVMFVYGCILQKAGRPDDAIRVFEQAVDLMKDKMGVLNSSSQLLQTLYDMYRMRQNDLKDMLAHASRYDDPDMAKSDHSSIMVA
jgi:GR25 family glycosyltransferase involved in LPS biosynthesis